MSRKVIDNTKCPRCETTKYRNPNMKLMINECGHSICDNCVEVEFVKGSNNCYQCGRSLRKNNFRIQIYESCEVEKEVDVRRRVMRDFNRREEEFPSLREYNDYLEFVETVIFNLTNGVNVESTKKQIEDYRRKHRDQIQRNKLSKGKNELMLDEIIQQEKATLSWLTNQTKHEEEERQRNERLEKEKLIEDLTFSAEGEADVIVQLHESELAEKRRMAKESEEAEEEDRRGGSYGKSLLFSSNDTVVTNRSVEVDAGEPFVYAPLELRLFGPPLPTPQELRGFARGLEPPLPHGLIGGGFHAEIAVARALTDAFSGLFMFGAGEKTIAEKTTDSASAKRRKTETVVGTGAVGGAGASGGGADCLNETAVMETSMMGNPGDVSLMDVSLMNSSRMSIA